MSNKKLQSKIENIFSQITMKIWNIKCEDIADHCQKDKKNQRQQKTKPVQL